MFVIPKAGMRVRDPVKHDYVPESGREVGAETAYWRRRVSDGDMTAEDAPPEIPPDELPPESRRSTASKKGSD